MVSPLSNYFVLPNYEQVSQEDLSIWCDIQQALNKASIIALQRLNTQNEIIKIALIIFNNPPQDERKLKILIEMNFNYRKIDDEYNELTSLVTKLGMIIEYNMKKYFPEIRS